MDSEETILTERVVTEYDGEGMEAAKEGIVETGEAAKETAVELEGMATAQATVSEEASTMGYHTLREAAHAIHGVETAAEGGHMSILRWIMSLRGLYELLVLNSFTAIATAIGTVAIAIGVWMKKQAEAREEISKDLDETVKKNAEAAAEIAKTNLAAGYESFKGELEEIKNRYAAINTEAKELLDHQIAMKKATTDLALANLEIEEQKALADAHGDPVKEAEARRDFGARKLALRQDASRFEVDAQAQAAKAAVGTNQKGLDEIETKKTEVQNEGNPERSAYDESKAAIENAVKELAGVGIKSDQQISLERLRKLQTKDAFNRTLGEEQEMQGLQAHQSEFEADSSTNPTFKKNSGAISDFALEKSRTKKELDQGGLSESSIKYLESALKLSEAAETVLKVPALIKEQKDQADAAEADRKKKLEDLQKKAADQKAARDKAQRQYEELTARQQSIDAQAKAEETTATAASNKQVRDSYEAEHKKEMEAAIKRQEAMIEGTKPTDANYSTEVQKLARLKNQALDSPAEGVEPTTADEALKSAEKQKIAADAQKKIEAANAARQKAAEKDLKNATPEQLEAEEEAARSAMSTTAHNIHSQGSAKESPKVVELKRAIDSMAARLKEHPNDASAQNQLAALIPSLVATLNQLATAQERSGALDLQAQMASLRAAQKRVEDYLKQQRTRH
jgi:hypothetical protein